MSGPSPPQQVLIVGAGEFGASAALALAEGAYKGRAELITVVERGQNGELEVDAASSDYNKVRADYADPIYQALALDAMSEWRTPRWKQHYHECGVVVCSSSLDPQVGYVRNSHRLNEESETAKVSKLEKGRGVQGLYKAGLHVGEFEGSEAYLNHVGGWAASRDAVLHTISLARSLGVTFTQGDAISLIQSTPSSSSVSSSSPQPSIRGVRLADGRTVEADMTILACGSWTPELLPELAEACMPCGQTVATILLNEEERERYQNMPVSLFMDTGFYCFPPTKNGVLKMGTNSRPRLGISFRLPPLPTSYDKERWLREAADPAVRIRGTPARNEAGAPRIGYSDRESGDFLFDFHPSYANNSLFVAAGGSGHAFKFLPLVPSWISSALSGTLPSNLARLWSFYGDKTRLDKSRGEGPIVRRDLDTGKVAQVRMPEIRARL
ncbi:hypothetical protein JCM11641_004099 [Rhodosporidiobolus odoratus]